MIDSSNDKFSNYIFFHPLPICIHAYLYSVFISICIFYLHIRCHFDLSFQLSLCISANNIIYTIPLLFINIRFSPAFCIKIRIYELIDSIPRNETLFFSSLLKFLPSILHIRLSINNTLHLSIFVHKLFVEK